MNINDEVLNQSHEISILSTNEIYDIKNKSKRNFNRKSLNQSLNNKSNKRSYCWNYFEIEYDNNKQETGYVICKCKARYAYNSSSTSAMNSHLLRCAYANNDSIQILKKYKNKASFIWNFYDIEKKDNEETGYVICKCGNRYQYAINNESYYNLLINHLKKCPVVNDLPSDILSNIKQLSGKDIEVTFQSIDKCNESLIDLIVSNKLPSNIINNNNFKSFIYNLNPKFDIPDNFDVNASIEERYKELKDKISTFLFDQLNNTINSLVSLTIDIRTTISEEICYAIITLYFIDDQWKYREFVLNVPVLLYPFTEKQLVEALFESISNWKITTKLISITNNIIINDSELLINLKPLVTYQSSESLAFNRCVVSLFNLIVDSGLVAAVNQINLLRSVVKLLSLPKYLQVYQEICLNDNFSEIYSELPVPTIDNKTNWKSTFDMINYALLNKSLLIKFSSVNNIPTIDESTWEVLKFVYDFLKSLVDYYQTIKSDDRPNIHTVLIQLYDLDKRIERLNKEASSKEVKSFASAVKSSYNKHVPAVSDIAIIAHVLDPRYKLEFIKYVKGQDEADRCKKIVTALYNNYYLTKVSNSSVKLSDDKSFASSFSLFQRSRFQSITPINELSIYLSEPLVVEDNYDLLQYWKSYSTKYTTLSRMAKDILTVQSTSLSNDLLYELTVNPLKEYPPNLSSNQIEMLACASSWIHSSL